jgi:signal transduction histidine kinase
MVTRRERRALALQQALAVAEKTAALQRSLQRAEKLATIGTLAAGVAHEVGTPLGIISGRAEQALARAQADDEPTKKALTSILAQVDKVSTTIRQLLDFARTRPVEAGPVAPGAILETCRGLLEHRFKQATVSLTVDAAPSLPPVLGDAGQLEQVFVNLLINAADACARGGTVNASVRAHGDKLRFEIQDDGCGILPQNLPQVLDPFFTTKKRGQGTGLGLTIAADIIKNHNGTLDIESEPGKGTKVSVELPRT